MWLRSGDMQLTPHFHHILESTYRTACEDMQEGPQLELPTWRGLELGSACRAGALLLRLILLIIVIVVVVEGQGRLWGRGRGRSSLAAGLVSQVMQDGINKATVVHFKWRYV